MERRWRNFVYAEVSGKGVYRKTKKIREGGVCEVEERWRNFIFEEASGKRFRGGRREVKGET